MGDIKRRFLRASEREKSIEAYLVEEVTKLGGLCYKWQGVLGAPDRIVIYGSLVIFVETKAPGKRLRKAQDFFHDKLISHVGPENCLIISSKDQVDDFISDLEIRGK